jgi:3-oxoacyl-[acyl-carrier protein] reductase
LDRIKGRLAIITGGSRGIGRGISEALARGGADLAVVYRRDKDAFDDLKSSLESSGVQIEGYQLDIAEYERVSKTFEEIHARFGNISILVNCAGRAPSTRTVYNVTVEEWHSVIDIDLHAAFYCIKAALKFMRERKKGHIINISSVVASTCQGGSCSYAAAKAGLEALTKVLAREEGRYGIRVNAVAPGVIVTDMSRRMAEVYGNERMKDIYESIPLGYLGDVRNIGSIVAYLVSPEGDYISGQILGIDGGMYYWKSSFMDT